MSFLRRRSPNPATSSPDPSSSTPAYSLSPYAGSSHLTPRNNDLTPRPNDTEGYTTSHTLSPDVRELLNNLSPRNTASARNNGEGSKGSGYSNTQAGLGLGDIVPISRAEASKGIGNGNGNRNETALRNRVGLLASSAFGGMGLGRKKHRSQPDLRSASGNRAEAGIGNRNERDEEVISFGREGAGERMESDSDTAPPTPNPFSPPSYSPPAPTRHILPIITTNDSSASFQATSQPSASRPTIRLVRSSTSGTTEGGQTILRSGSRQSTSSSSSSTLYQHGKDTASRNQTGLTPRTYLPDSPYIYPSHITSSYDYSSPNTTYTATLPRGAAPSAFTPRSLSDLVEDRDQDQDRDRDRLAYQISRQRLTHRHSPLLPQGMKSVERSPRHVISGSPFVGGGGGGMFWGDEVGVGTGSGGGIGFDNRNARVGSPMDSASDESFMRESEMLESRLQEELGMIGRNKENVSSFGHHGIRMEKAFLPQPPLVPRFPGSRRMARQESAQSNTSANSGSHSTTNTTESDTLVGSEGEGGRLDGLGMKRGFSATSASGSKGSLPLPDLIRKADLLRRFKANKDTTTMNTLTPIYEPTTLGAKRDDSSKPSNSEIIPLRPHIFARLFGSNLPATKDDYVEKPGEQAVLPVPVIPGGEKINPRFTSKFPRMRGVYGRKNKWGKFKWLLFLSVLVVFAYGLGMMIWALLIWCRTIPLADITIVSDPDVVVYLTFAAILCLFNSLIGLIGTLLNSRPILSIYSFLLWPCLLALCFIGYSSYKRESLNLEGKLDMRWSREMDDEERLRVQEALSCCGYYDPFHQATYSRSCFPRSILPGCKSNYYTYEKNTLGIFATVAFSVIPIHLVVIVLSLICSNHVNNVYGKGMTPKQYRLSMADVRANALAALAAVQPVPSLKKSVSMQDIERRM